jgi:hypothetical protein
MSFVCLFLKSCLFLSICGRSSFPALRRRNRGRAERFIEASSEETEELFRRVESDIPAGIDLFNPAHELEASGFTLWCKPDNEGAAHDGRRMPVSKNENVTSPWKNRDAFVPALRAANLLISADLEGGCTLS